MDVVPLMLFIPSLALLLYLGFRDFGKTLRRKDWFRERFWVILSIPVLIITGYFISRWNITGEAFPREAVRWTFSFLLAGLISLFWILYLTWLDIYERENRWYLLLVFVMCCLSTFAVFPVSDFIEGLGFTFNGNVVNDFLYCWIGIGMVEEMVKVVPLLLIWRFSKQLDEPFDFILYACVGALGFAFVENIMYLYRSELTAVYARALYSSVAHMFFSSIIAYGWMWREHRGHPLQLGSFLPLFALASMAHGFYDFWLIRYDLHLELLSLLFFLISLQLWVTMKNNLINISQFYKPSLKLRSHLFLYRLVSLMLIVLVVALLGYNLMYGPGATRRFALNMTLRYSYVFAYVTVSFSSFTVIPGYMGRLKLPRNFLLPRIIRHPDLRGHQFYFQQKGRIGKAIEALDPPLLARSYQLTHRVVIDGLANSYRIDGDHADLIIQFVKRDSKVREGWRVAVFGSKPSGPDKVSFKSIQLRKLGELWVKEVENGK